MIQAISQEDAILKYLQDGNSLTSLEALNLFQCFRLASRISNLKKCGHNINVELINTPTQKRIAKYTYIKPQPQQEFLFQ